MTGRWFTAYVVAPLLLCSLSLAPSGARPALSIAVRGNHLVNAEGRTVVLRGADTTGTEYACVSEDSIFDGKAEASAASIAAMRSWHFNVARVELNESCWLGIQGVRRNVSGAAYRHAIHQYVAALNRAGMYVIIDMHFSSTGGQQKATGQVPMPDARYAPAFWASVAQYAGDLDRWARYAPADPLHQLAASIHIYWRNRAHPDYSPCYRAICWHRVLAPLSAHVPIVVGEFGELDCGDTLYPPFLRFADQHGISYLAWAWFTGKCASEPSLITSYTTGAPTPYGVGYRNHLRSLRPG